jgi:hypothetical protein
MIAVHFNKDYARAVLDAIQTGKPIPPPPGPGWTGNAMLALAGILYAAVFSQGSHTHQLAGITEAMRRAMPAERQEAVEDTFRRDIHDGIEFLSFVTFHLIDDEWDEHYTGPEVKAVVYETPEGKKSVRPAKGFKGHEDVV